MPIKLKHKQIIFILILLLVFIDQFIKIYIKTHFIIGQEINLIGNSIKLHFIENDGMAYGLKFSDGAWAKLLLTIFRFVAITYGIYYFIKYILNKNEKFINFILAIIIAGAIGNLLDSIYYGVIFTESPTIYDIVQTPSTFTLTKGYNTWLLGRVVDMIYCPIIRTTLPNWIPYFGNQPFEFFSPIFNFADFCISIGVVFLLIINKRFLRLLNNNK